MCGLHQESNCFNPVPTPIDMFNILEGESIKRTASTNTSSGGIVSYLEDRNDVEIIYSILMRAPSGAPLKSEVYEYFMNKVIPDLKSAGNVDGIALSLHGATMAENSPDICGDIIETNG